MSSSVPLHAAIEPTPAPAFTFTSPLFRSDESAAYLGYRGKHALRSLYRFIAQNGIRTSRRFRTLLIAKADLDRAIGAGHQAVQPRAFGSARRVHGSQATSASVAGLDNTVVSMRGR